MPERSLKDILFAFGPSFILILIAIGLAYKYIDPAAPKHMIISTGEAGSDFQKYAELYRDVIKEDGVELEIQPSKGNWDNLKRIQDPNSTVDAGFVEDGLGTVEKYPDVSSLGSLYYEPLWVFYKGKTEFHRFSELANKKIAIGEKGGGTHSLAMRILKASGIDDKAAQLLEVADQASADALRAGTADVAIFLATPEDKIIQNLLRDPSVRLMSVDQFEAIVRQFPYLHHLVLPHGAIDLKRNVPEHDVDLVSPTATLMIRDSLHPALIYLLLKAAAQVHSDPSLFEKKNEFPIDKDYQFPLADEAKTFYKSGPPFWQRYLPFWLATLVDRFLLLAIPLIALIIPIIKMVPRILEWRVKSRIYQRYGELKFLETQIKPDALHAKYEDYLHQLSAIEDRVSHMKIPLDFSDYFYALREHIQFVRGRLERLALQSTPEGADKKVSNEGRLPF